MPLDYDPEVLRSGGWRRRHPVAIFTAETVRLLASTQPAVHDDQHAARFLRHCNALGPSLAGPDRYGRAATLATPPLQASAIPPAAVV